MNIDFEKPHFKAHQKRNDGIICGEIKLLITLRLLAGTSYLDLMYLYGVSYASLYRISHKANKEWICNDEVFPINSHDQSNNLNSMKKTAAKFADGSSCGYLKRCIGAIGGWLVRIKRPRDKNNQNLNPGTFYSHEGFYAFNVQMVVDKHTETLWKSELFCGTEHDSTAFQNTNLYTQLVKKIEFLYNKHLYLVGESAYSLRSFLLVPYDSVQPNN